MNAKIHSWILIAGILLLGGIESYSQGPAALRGVVSSQQEGAMEGVLVSARKAGSNMTVSVVSDSQGRYSFPGGRLESGDYRLKTRAPGFDLNDSGVVKIEAGKTTQLNLTLRPTDNLAAQMTPGDWFLSNPEIKTRLIDDMILWLPQDCAGCHGLTHIMTSKYTASQWPAILRRMGTYDSASLYEPGEVDVPIVQDRELPDYGSLEELSQFLASINLSSRPDGTWPFELKTMARPSGRGTRVILTEYELPRRESQPHDVVVDKNGMLWYNDHGNQYIGKINPRTGEVKEWLVPGVAPEDAVGESSGRSHFDRRQDNVQGDLWFGNVKVNVDTDEFTVGHGAVLADGMVWRTRSSPMLLEEGIRSPAAADADPMVRGISEVLKIDPETGETVRRFPGPNRAMRFYGGMKADSQGNMYGSSLHWGVVGIMNGQSGEWAFVPAPSTTRTGTSAGPRRNHMDAQDRFWYSQYFSGGIGMFDSKTWQIKEWSLDPNALPYGVGVDKNGEAWAAGKGPDYLYRLNPSTGEVTAYWNGSKVFNQARQLFVDNTTSPGTVWIGQNHNASVVRIEPLD